MKFTVAWRVKVDQASDWGSYVQIAGENHEGRLECSQVRLLRLSGLKKMKDFRGTSKVFKVGRKECLYFVRDKEITKSNQGMWGLQVAL